LKFTRIFPEFFLRLAILGAVAVPASADEIPDSAKLPCYETSPEVYNLLSEDEHFRVILATFQPGQGDEWHTHATDLTNYTLTECHLRALLPHETTGELSRESNTVGFSSAGSMHKVTNIGEGECRLLIVERK